MPIFLFDKLTKQMCQVHFAEELEGIDANEVAQYIGRIKKITDNPGSYVFFEVHDCWPKALEKALENHPNTDDQSDECTQHPRIL